jgi:hypothetical protein
MLAVKLTPDGVCLTGVGVGATADTGVTSNIAIGMIVGRGTGGFGIDLVGWQAATTSITLTTSNHFPNLCARIDLHLVHLLYAPLIANGVTKEFRIPLQKETKTALATLQARAKYYSVLVADTVEAS